MCRSSSRATFLPTIKDVPTLLWSTTTKGLMNDCDDDIDYSNDDAFDKAIDMILDDMYRSTDRGMQAKARQFEAELQETHAQTFWMTRIVNAWARSQDSRAVQHAERVVAIMTNLYNAGYDCCKPNTVTYNSLLNCLAHSKNPNAPERAEELLNHMWDLVQTRQNSFVRPSTISYSSVLQAWSRSIDYQNKGPRADLILKDQWRRFHQGNDKCRPDGRTYNHVVAAWAHSKQTNAYESADALVQEMWNYYQQDISNDKIRPENVIKPNKVTMTLLLTSLIHATRHDPRAARRADDIVNRMWTLSKTEQDHKDDMKPNAIIYTTLLQVWAESRDRSATRRVLELWEEMKQHDTTTLGGSNAADMKPSLAAYSAVLEKLSHSNDHILDRHHDAEDEHHQHHEATTMTAADLAESMLQEMWTRTTDHGESHVHPNTQIYQFVIQACARRRHPDAAIESSERVLNDLIARYRAGDQRCMPNSAVFVSVLQAFSTRQTTNKINNHTTAATDIIASLDPDRIISLLKQMYQLQKEGARRVAPDRKVMMMVMELLTKTQERHCLIKAQEVLDIMWDNAVGTGRPDSVTYLTIMSAWTKSREPDAVDRAEALYHDLWRRYELTRGKHANTATNTKKVKPDTVVCNAMMTAYAKGRRDDAVEKAQSILDDMLRRHAEGDSTICPDTVSYNSLLNALAKSKQPGSAEKAEEILREIWRISDNDEHGTAAAPAGNGSTLGRSRGGVNATKQRPNIVTVSTVIDAWSHAKTIESPFRAQALLDEAYERYKAGDESVKPNSFTYTPVILAWSSCRDPQGPFKAEAMLERMQEEGFHPNKILYAQVIGSYSTLETRQGAERAEALLRDQWNKFDNGSNKALNPDTNLCNTVILAWANSQAAEDEAPKRALGIFDEMVKRSARGDRSVTPTRTTYNAVLSCWSKSGGGPPSGSISAAQEAQNWMDDLWSRAHHHDHRNHDGAEKSTFALPSPDRINYTNLMYAWARSTAVTAPDVAVEKATSILNFLWERHQEDERKDALHGPSIMKPDAAVYAAVMQAYINHQRQDTYDMAKAMVQEMKDRGIASSTRLLGTYIKALGTKAGTNEEIENVLQDMELCSSDGQGLKKSVQA
ncbi:endonuclease [Fragilaria crotonensis]|nr:endonuclease [Fragilaria crotonensis]